MKVLVLYTRLTNYWMACMEQAVQTHGVEFLVYRDAPSKQAPFEIKDMQGIELRSNDQLNQKSVDAVVSGYIADLVYVAGWSNKRHLKLAATYRKAGVTTVMGMDNHWTGSIKQRLASLLSYQLVRKYFDFIWIPGEPQRHFARKLGFKEVDIKHGLYCADERLFENIARPKKNETFMFVGRLVEHKGLRTLFLALEQLIEEGLEFRMEIIGNGPLKDEIPQHPNVIHHPFIPPDQLPQKLAQAGVFVLPSDYEAWGVVVHEAVQAGMPVITTYQTGAGGQFVRSGVNGGLFEAGESTELVKWMKAYMDMPESAYLKQVDHSREISRSITREGWVSTLVEMQLKNQIS